MADENTLLVEFKQHGSLFVKIYASAYSLFENFQSAFCFSLLLLQLTLPECVIASFLSVINKDIGNIHLHALVGHQLISYQLLIVL